MNKRSVSAIVLAAGKGVRMKSREPKILSRLCGKSLLDTVLDNLLKVKALDEIIVVLNKDILFLEKTLREKSKKIKVAVQVKPLGTADAVKAALAKIPKKSTDIFVIGADIVLFKISSIQALISMHLNSDKAATLITAISDSPHGYGRIIRNKAGQVEAIREEVDLGEQEKDIGEINSGIYVFKKKELLESLKYIKPSEIKKEYYLTDAISILSAKGVETVAAETMEEVMGINSPSDLARAVKIQNLRTIGEFLMNGVKIIDPQTTYIENGVTIGEDSVIHPFTYIETEVRIGKNCSIGPFARLRKGVDLADRVSVGNFVELSRAKVGSGTIMKHFCYLGDSELGNNVNVGAGTVTANYDGKNKNKTIIEDDVFIGCDTVLIAPVKVGKKAVTAAGAVLAKKRNVPGGKLAIGVPARITELKRKALGSMLLKRYKKH